MDSGHGVGWGEGSHSVHRLPLPRAEDKMSSDICLIQRKSSSNNTATEVLDKKQHSGKSLKEVYDLERKTIEECFGNSKLQEQRHKERNK